MSHRKILYGYQIQNGELTVVKAEASVVARVASLYLEGLSYQKLADLLNQENIPFSQEAPAWDKHKVKRLLENPRYTGQKGYPAILDGETFHCVQSRIQGKTAKQMLTFTAMAWGGDTVGGVSLIDLRQKLKDITAQQALLLDQVLEHMDDEILNARLKAMMDEKQALQERIADAEQSETHNAAQESRMAELREWMAKLEVNQQYSDEQVRMAVERITVVDAETIRIRFRYPGAELEKKL